MSSRAQILTMVSKNSSLRPVEIARELGISRERVRQIMMKLGLTTRQPRMPKKLCPTCSAPIYRQNKMHCSRQCQVDSKYITLVCNECDSTFQRRKVVYARNITRGYRHTWCSKECQGKYLSSYGKGRGPKP